MEEIEVGEYIRTKDGIIAKLIDYEEDLDMYYFDKVIYRDYEPITTLNNHNIKEYIVKHSKNIIDLIELRRLCEWRDGIFDNRRL